MKPLVYVAGPYSHPDPVLNTRRACQIGDELVALGYAVIVPHLSLLWHAISPASVEEWYARDLDVLAHCDAVLRFEGASTGADAEVAAADALGIPVVYGTDDPELGRVLRLFGLIGRSSLGDESEPRASKGVGLSIARHARDESAKRSELQDSAQAKQRGGTS